MGGWGSGPYGPMGPLVRKRTVEETVSLHIQSFKEALNGKAGTYSWNNSKQSIGFVGKDEYILLSYRANKEKIKDKVFIASTKVGYGERLWFECPSCQEKRARLYLAGRYFRCRKCSNLTYLTCQESGDPLDYLSLKIRRLQRKLGMDKPEIYQVPYFKPKNMQYKTFKRLRDKLIDLQDERDREFIRQSRGRFNIC